MRIIQAIKEQSKSKKPPHTCSSCKQSYRKQDFTICPHCGSDGGGITPKEWKPSKRQKKEFIKKVNQQ